MGAMCDWYWWDGDKDKSGTIDFKEFLHWYSSNGFNEELLLTKDERNVREIAKAWGVSADYADRIKKEFDLCDKDQSGDVTMDEFTEILHKCLKVPSSCGIPPSRIKYFWSQIDTDGSGKITFAEFFAWWLKYFDPEQKNAEMPFEAFYKQVRRIGACHLDPPAYQPCQALHMSELTDTGAYDVEQLRRQNEESALFAGMRKHSV